jgi:hypothetical protein
MSYKCTDKLNNGNIKTAWKTKDKVYLAKNSAFRDCFIADIMPGCKKSRSNHKMYEDKDGRELVLKITNDWIKKSPDEYKKGNFFFYRDQNNKLKKCNGYYVLIIFSVVNWYTKIILPARAVKIREHQECICWENIRQLALVHGCVRQCEYKEPEVKQ